MAQSKRKRANNDPKGIVIQNPIKLQGFSVQKIGMFEAQVDSFCESHLAYLAEKNLVGDVQRAWKFKQRHAYFVGFLVFLGLVSSQVALFYTYGA